MDIKKFSKIGLIFSLPFYLVSCEKTPDFQKSIEAKLSECVANLDSTRVLYDGLVSSIREYEQMLDEFDETEFDFYIWLTKLKDVDYITSKLIELDPNYSIRTESGEYDMMAEVHKVIFEGHLALKTVIPKMSSINYVEDFEQSKRYTNKEDYVNLFSKKCLESAEEVKKRDLRYYNEHVKPKLEKYLQDDYVDRSSINPVLEEE